MDGHAASQADRDASESQRDHVRQAHNLIERFAVQWFWDENPADYDDTFRAAMVSVVGGVDEEGLEDASLVVLRDIQARLAQAEGGVERPEARILARTRSSAVRALIYLHGDRRAKELVLAAGDLTICTGDENRIWPQARRPRHVVTLAGEIRFSAKGCGAVFHENTVLGGNSMWPSFCEGCQSENRKPGRDQGRRLRRRINETILAPSVYLADADGTVSRYPSTT